MMDLLTKLQRETLATNGAENSRRIAAGEDTVDHHPVVKLFTPDGAATWLLTETEPEDPDIAFGLCDLGFGTPELGSVRLSELASVRGRLGLPIERDLHFKAKQSLEAYAQDARGAERIVT